MVLLAQDPAGEEIAVPTDDVVSAERVMMCEYLVQLAACENMK